MRPLLTSLENTFTCPHCNTLTCLHLGLSMMYSAMRSGLPGAKPKPPWVPKRPFVPATPEKRQGGQREAAKRHKIAGRHRGRSMSCYCFISCSFCCRLQLLCLLEIIISDPVAVAA